MEEQRLAQTRDAVVKKMSVRLIKQLRAQVDQIDETIEKQIDDDDTLKGQSERL